MLLLLLLFIIVIIIVIVYYYYHSDGVIGGGLSAAGGALGGLNRMADGTLKAQHRFERHPSAIKCYTNLQTSVGCVSCKMKPPATLSLFSYSWKSLISEL